MKQKIIPITLTTIFGLLIMSSLVFAASRYNITSTLGGVSGDFFDLDGNFKVQSITVGAQGTGGVTFFNGTIINQTTTDEGADIPVTFGDNVRIDGTLFRGATEGPGDDMPVKLNDDLKIYGDLTVDGSSPFIKSLTAGDNVSVTDNGDETWTIAATDTDTDTDTLGSLNCNSSQVAKYNGTAWACGDDTDTDIDTDTDTGTLTFFLAGYLTSGYGGGGDGTYLSGWKPTSGKTLIPLKVTINAQVPAQGGESSFGFSDDGGSNYDVIVLAEDTFMATDTSFAVFDAIAVGNGLTIQYIDGPGGENAPGNVNVIIEYQVIAE